MNRPRIAPRLVRRCFWVLLGLVVAAGSGAGVYAIVTNLSTINEVHDPVAVHADQDELRSLVANNQGREAFEEAFELGDELFATQFNALDGGGANVGTGDRTERGRLLRMPRAAVRGRGRDGGPERAS
jgi:hypothetical protein